MASDDPEFERKAAGRDRAVFESPRSTRRCSAVDEKTAIQALDRLDPVLPLSPGRAERHGFEYHRHGTLSLYAAFNTRTGEVLGKTAERHTSAEFVAFLATWWPINRSGGELHVILDNLSAHKTKHVDAFLAEHPHVHLHFTPTYSSWLNQVELWFAKIERDVIARGIFTSVKDLARKLMRYIRHYNAAPKPVKWKYADPSRRITYFYFGCYRPLVRRASGHGRRARLRPRVGERRGDAEADVHAPGHPALAGHEPRARRPDPPPRRARGDGVEPVGHEAEHHEDEPERQHLRADGTTGGIDELRQEGQEEQRRLRVQHVDDGAVEEGPAPAGSPASDRARPAAFYRGAGGRRGR